MINYLEIINELKQKYNKDIMQKLELYNYLVDRFKKSIQKQENISQFIEIVFCFINKLNSKDIECCPAAEMILAYYKEDSSFNILEKIISDFKEDKNRFLEEIYFLYRIDYWRFVQEKLWEIESL